MLVATMIDFFSPDWFTFAATAIKLSFLAPKIKKPVGLVSQNSAKALFCWIGPIESLERLHTKDTSQPYRLITHAIPSY